MKDILFVEENMITGRKKINGNILGTNKILLSL